MLSEIDIPSQQIRDFCQRNHIRKLSLFGSILENRFAEGSDIDVLVEFDPDHIPGWEFVQMQDELSAIFGREVDLNTPGFLSETFREDVLQKAFIAYERA